MSDILLLEERVQNTISLGESHFREFKSALHGLPAAKKPRPLKDICRDIAEALVAFANADGGELLVGVEDDGTVSGLAHDEAEIDLMLAAAKNNVLSETPLPMTRAAKIVLDGNVVLFFSVSKGTTEIYQLADGRCVRRKDQATLPVSFKQLNFERREITSREYDRAFVDGASVNDLDLRLLTSLIAGSGLRGMSIEKYLQQFDLAEYALNGLRLRRAALLLFAIDMQRWNPRSEVRILKIAGNELKSGEDYNVISDESVRGNIFQLLSTAWERLRPYLALKTEFSAEAKFVEKFIYPELACREALVNAIAHRDYQMHTAIEVRIFDDYLEVRNPGALLSTLTISNLEALQGAQESRNVLVARVLRENQEMRELGEGVKRMFDVMAQSALPQPLLYSNRVTFSIQLSRKPVDTSNEEP
ncbi:MAG: putative DNA binding domain-containing protein [Armatimonadetes bacterium]|nr:putative DNA binding domain-containing protein [Anaerolineae bacterium]